MDLIQTLSTAVGKLVQAPPDAHAQDPESLASALQVDRLAWSSCEHILQGRVWPVQEEGRGPSYGCAVSQGGTVRLLRGALRPAKPPGWKVPYTSR